MSDLRELIDQSEDELFQRIIDEQEGAWALAELEKSDGGPSDAELAHWREQLTALVKDTVPAPKRIHWKRIIIAAAIIAAVLILTVTALRNNVFNFIERVQDTFTQVQTGRTAEHVVADWINVYLPDYLPSGFLMSDATENEDVRVVEYVGSDGARFTYTQYGPDSIIRLDTEKAEKDVCQVGAQEAYLIQKEGVSTLYWAKDGHFFCIEYKAEFIADSEIVQVAESLIYKEK